MSIVRPRALVAAVAVAVALVAAAGGCTAGPPEVRDLDDGDVGGEDVPFADTVLAWTEGGVAMTCGDVLPECGGAAATCGPTEVLGPPDGIAFALEPGTLIQLAFLCSHVLERGGDDEPADFKLWATFAEGASAVVEVSFDHTVWYALGIPAIDDPEIDLEPSGFDVVRFIRLSNRGSAAIQLDAVEALR